MASTTLMETKDGRRFYKIAVSRGRGKSPYTKRWYVPDGWSRRAIDRELSKVTAEFERQCETGEVFTRAERKEQEDEARREAAKLKTLRQYVEGVYQPTKSLSWAEGTRSNVAILLKNHVLPALGDQLITEITPAMLTKLLTDFQKKGYSRSSLALLYARLNNIFGMAFDDDTIKTNPMFKVKCPAPPKDGQPTKSEAEKAYTVEELRRILKCAENEPLQWQVFINLCADLGARNGELCALKWTDVDWQNSRIKIERNLQYTPAKGTYIAAPKNGQSRVVDIGEQTLALLRKHQQAQAGICMSQWIFTHPRTAEVMSPRSPGKYFETFGERYGFENFHPHKLRHTSASIAITEGADVVSVSVRLGHRNPTTTLRMYAHANEESIRRTGQAVRDALKISGK